MSSRSQFKGSTSARFVKNSGSNSQPYQRRSEEDLLSNFNNENAHTKLSLVQEADQIDSVFGFDRYESGPKKVGWLINMHTTTIPSEDLLQGYSGVDYYFLDEEGGGFKVTKQYDPYFFVICKKSHESEVEEYLRKQLEGLLKKASRVEKEDLSLPNHLIGLKRTLIQLSFHNISNLLEARRIIAPIVKQNQLFKEQRDVYNSDLNYNLLNEEEDLDFNTDSKSKPLDIAHCLEDIREYDVPYHVRVSIDNDYRIGKWYTLEATDSAQVSFTEMKDKIAFADPIILAFDIETTKAPLKFPDSSIDQIMMISYMIDGEGFLITNREIINAEIEDFEYTPKPEYPGLFTIFNEPDEKALIERFFEHIREVRPTVIATFNGDFFDWPFVEKRAFFHGIDMFREIGFAKDVEDEYKSKYCVHMDCYRWVKRDSYLPQGSQGLKAVTTVKLGYNPTELDPELMTPYAYEKPQLLAEYSVSDAVATYYLYYKYVHPFVFSLCTIIPLNPDEVLRKGTGTLCEMLLMVQAYQNNILLPNKHTDPLERFYEGHLIESETYVGGHVESLEAGVFRSDISTDFQIDPTAIDEILSTLDQSLKFSIEVESKKQLKDITNYDEVYAKIKGELLELRNNPKRHEAPLIYHVDVASMYPNIMTTNRLQPDSMKTDQDCAECDFNRPGKTCDRRLLWAWRGEFYPADYSEYKMIEHALSNDTFAPDKPWLPRKTFDQLSHVQRAALVKSNLSEYSRKVYHRIKQTKTIEKEAIVCQRENPFYINTVRSFRDRRYEFKGLAKVWKGKASKIAKDDRHSLDEAKKMIVLYDSLQLAHKVILNSFYGYVMRKGSRWYSVEMAGITCLTGATIIQLARSLVERLGRPLELDTDGIWCILPSSFPEDFDFKMKDGKTLTVSYPCSMLNFLVHEKFTNHQYQELVDPITHKYKTYSDNSIFFELDGPYKAMILPTSKEEGKGLKKRYAVFNFDGSLAELKGFELKRRGELQLIKNFQSDIFKLFLHGDTLEGCYQTVANVANRWLDVLDSKGANVEDEDLIELICENRSMSKTLAEYGTQKSTSITTARRLGEFLGEEMVKDKGLACKYVIANRPLNAPITERAIPVTIFSSDAEIKKRFLRRWLGDSSLDNFDPRTIIDWEYYTERLASVVQKIITIPAALQNISNPVPRIAHPEWLQKKVNSQNDSKKQSSLTQFFGKTTNSEIMKDISNRFKDIEDFGADTNGMSRKMGKVTSRKRKQKELESRIAEKEQKLLENDCPNELEDYGSFLKYQKAKWKLQSQNRERRRKLFGTSANTATRGTIGNIMRKKAESYVGSSWQVLQYKHDSSCKPGEVKALVFIDGKVQTFTIAVPRKVFLGLKTTDSGSLTIPDECTIEPSTNHLPKGEKVESLFKLTMSEEKFNSERGNCNGLFQHEDVKCVYESQIDCTERVIVELGNSIKFQENQVGALGKAMQNGFNQNNFTTLPSERYLSHFNMNVTYLIHIVANGYEVFSLFKSWDPMVSVFVLKPNMAASSLPRNMESVYQDYYQSKKERLSHNIIQYDEQLSFNVVDFTDKDKLLRNLNTRCGKANEEKNSKSLMVIQSNQCTKLIRALKNLNEQPVISMNLRELNLSPLSWKSSVINKIINHYLSLGAGLKDLISMARYGNIPLCNLNVEDKSYLIDIQYARKLIELGIVLWWSPNPLPDHGGFELDQSMTNTEKSLEFPTINKPEIYETVCLELDLSNLTINTILTSALINEAEGLEIGDNENTTSFAEDIFSTPALQALRLLLKSWWDDALKNNVDADIMVFNFMSWVEKTSSYLYDPSLLYHVYNLTKKSLLHLLGEFKRLGSTIIFANRNKIVLKTSKLVVENSYAYGQYIIKTVRSKAMFSYLEFQVVRYWDMLIWMDQYNYGGNGCAEITSNEKQDLELINHWQLQQFLPPVLQQEFEDWVVVILDSFLKCKQLDLNGSQSNGTPRQTQIQHILKKQNQQQSLSTDFVYEKPENNIIDMFGNVLEKRIITLKERQLRTLLNPALKAEYEFPKLAGSQLDLSDPTLEFVKFLCHILSLSKSRNIEVRVLRRNILKLFDVKEFSAEATFKNPSASLRLYNVHCEICNHITDLDLCRDAETEIFNCQNCKRRFNKLALEERLIADAHKLLVHFYNQDLKCSKCHKLRSSELQLYCSCSGSWIGTVNRSDIVKRMRTFHTVARFYDFNMLKEVTTTGE
ncbi:BA75_01783T0 [Komagataella pastoris]|uniref:DNA polymerase epsilon catalytic subunit n=1 Tax=Komagataella pastoris TaxID=4922 RepID=A0A1B2JA06_PICPA|nr:BA75_01783T0 [Komagataella pastoris]